MLTRPQSPPSCPSTSRTPIGSRSRAARQSRPRIKNSWNSCRTSTFLSSELMPLRRTARLCQGPSSRPPACRHVSESEPGGQHGPQGASARKAAQPLITVESRPAETMCFSSTQAHSSAREVGRRESLRLQKRRMTCRSHTPCQGWRSGGSMYIRRASLCGDHSACDAASRGDSLALHGERPQEGRPAALHHACRLAPRAWRRLTSRVTPAEASPGI